MDSKVIRSLQTRSTYLALVDTLPLSLLIKDVDGRRVFANQTYLKLRETNLDDLVGRLDHELFPAHIADQYRQGDLEVMRSGKTMHSLEETFDANNNRLWVESIKSPIFDPDGRAIGIQILFWDVSDRVRAEQALRREKNLLATLLHHIPDSIYFKDRESRFIRISEAMATKFGLENSGCAEGLTDADIFTGQHAGEARRDELRIMETREPLVDRVERETWPDHEDTWCLTTKMPMIEEDGHVNGTFGISRDITELKKSQDALEKALIAAGEANRAKSDFLANMSHEIRTPMNAIIGISELLSNTRLDAKQSDYLTLVRDSADSLLRLLNDILDFSKIEARKMELESIAFSIRDLVEKTGRSQSLRASEKGLELACRVASDVPDRLLGDPGRLRQVITNLVGNAVKFTDEGEVLVEVCRGTIDSDSDPADERIPIEFRVRDTGIGIPESKLSSVLEAFTQADTSTTRRFGGTGLGLAISKQLVELMDGKLELESQVGRGTSFFFTARFPKASSTNSSSDSSLQTLTRELVDLPVLVVDDNATNRKILNEILLSWRLEPSCAEGGAEAIKMLKKADRSGHPYAMVILDCMMPEMDGFELARQIRVDHDINDVKLIILSSADRQEDVHRCESLGISRYLIKPVVQSELLDTVLQVMNITQPTRENDEQAAIVCPPLRVLVAEDGLANQHVAVGMLQAAGHHAVVASDGRETIARWQKEPFDVILMDMHMPVMDGIEATMQIRAAEESSGEHIPIIALTAAAMKEDADACISAGMDAHLAKPIHPRQLQETLARFAPERTILSAMTTSVTAEGKDSSLTTHEGSSMDRSKVGRSTTGSGRRMADRFVEPDDVENPSIDLRASATRVPGGLQGVRRLSEVFIPECESLMETLVKEIPDGDVAVIRRSAHTLKGSANLFFAKRVADLAARLEEMAGEKDLTSSQEVLDELKHESNLMLRAIRNFLDLTAE